MIIDLTPGEAYLAATAGLMRQFNAETKGKKPNWGQQSNWNDHINGAIYEMVVAKHYKLFWAGGLKTGDDDVQGLEVRGSAYREARLPLHPTDKDNSPYIFVVKLSAWKFKICGWVYGKEGKRQELWEDPTGKKRHAYWVPQDQLKSIDSLEWPRLNDLARPMLVA